MFNNKLKNKGFSLVEVLIAMGILAIIVAPMLRSFVFSYNMNAKSRHRMDAVNMSENLLEGIKGNTLEDDVKKFTTSVSFDLIDTNLISSNGLVEQILPNEGELKGNTGYVSLAADDGISQVTTDASGSYVFTPSTNESKKYFFHVKNITPQKVSYDAFIEIDPSPYKGTGKTNGLGKYYHNNALVGSVSSVNNDENLAFMEDESQDLDILSTLYTNGLIGQGSSYPDISDETNTAYGENVLYRDININITDANVSVVYDYSAKVAGFSEVALKTSQKPTTSSSKPSDLKNIYVFYYPIYSSKAGNIHDQFHIYNQKKYPVNVYLVKQEKTLETTSLQVAETMYKTAVYIEENNKSGAYTDHAATIMTNIGTNLAAEYVDGLSATADQGNFYYNDMMLSGTSKDELVKTLDNKEARDRYFDVKIRVFESKNVTDGTIPKDEDLVYEVTGSTQE